MGAVPGTFLVFMLLAAFQSVAAAGAVLEPFFGTYGGFGRAEDTAGSFITTERNFGLAIRPLGGEGFEVAWATGKLRSVFAWDEPTRVKWTWSEIRFRG